MKFKTKSDNFKTNSGNLSVIFEKIEKKTKKPEILKKIIDKKLFRLCGGF